MRKISIRIVDAAIIATALLLLLLVCEIARPASQALGRANVPLRGLARALLDIPETGVSLKERTCTHQSLGDSGHVVMDVSYRDDPSAGFSADPLPDHSSPLLFGNKPQAATYKNIRILPLYDETLFQGLKSELDYVRNTLMPLGNSMSMSVYFRKWCFASEKTYLILYCPPFQQLMLFTKH
jgi:hypothetical protein